MAQSKKSTIKVKLFWDTRANPSHWMAHVARRDGTTKHWDRQAHKMKTVPVQTVLPDNGWRCLWDWNWRRSTTVWSEKWKIGYVGRLSAKQSRAKDHSLTLYHETIHTWTCSWVAFSFHPPQNNCIRLVPFFQNTTSIKWMFKCILLSTWRSRFFKVRQLWKSYRKDLFISNICSKYPNGSAVSEKKPSTSPQLIYKPRKKGQANQQ